MKVNEILAEQWSQKYKNSINCSHPRGFSQRAHCAGKKKHNESVEMEMVCEDCGMCQTHGNLDEIKKGQPDANGYTRCWPGKHAVGTKKGKNGGQVRNCKPNESVAESEEKRCMQCGMKGCKCPGKSCKCKPIAGWIPNKGFRKAMEESIDTELEEEFDLIESIIERLAEHNGVDAEVIWEDLETLTEDELYAFAVTSEPIMESQGVMEGVDIGQEWMSDTELDQYVPDRLQQQWRELLGYDEDGNPSALWANLTGGYEPDINDPQHRALMVKVANKWFAAKKIPNVKFFNVKDSDDELEWLVQIGEQGVAEGSELKQAKRKYNQAAKDANADQVGAGKKIDTMKKSLRQKDLGKEQGVAESEAWQKANNRDRTDGMSRKAVNTYRREHPGSKLQTAVTTKPSKLKKGSKASKRRKSYCSRSRGQMKMHSISCSKTPDKAICKARRRWNC